MTPPCPDELEWIAELAARFDVDVAPYAAAVFGEVSAKVYGGLTLRRGRRAGAAARLSRRRDARRCAGCRPSASVKPGQGEVRLVAYKPLFSGAAVERVTELQFQRPQAELELSAEDAGWRGIADRRPRHRRDERSAITLPARVNRRLRKGIARVALEHANGLGGIVELSRATEEVGA